MEQLSLFDMGVVSPGDTTEDRANVGRQLTWEEACRRVGRIVWYEHIMQSLTYWEAVIPEKRLNKAITFYAQTGEKLEVEKSDRLVCYDGTRQRKLIDEHFVSGTYRYPEGSAFYSTKEDT